jgi:hypothetical protein
MIKNKLVEKKVYEFKSITCDMCGATSEGIGKRWPGPNVSGSWDESLCSAYEIKLECTQVVDTYDMKTFQGEVESSESIDLCHDCWVKLIAFLKSEGLKTK